MQNGLELCNVFNYPLWCSGVEASSLSTKSTICVVIFFKDDLKWPPLNIDSMTCEFTVKELTISFVMLKGTVIAELKTP